MAAAVTEAQPGARYQVLHGTGHQDLARTRERGDSGADVNGNAAHLIPHDLALAGMEPGADVDPERPDVVGDRAGAADTARRTVEGRQEAVTGRVDFTAPEPLEITPDNGVMAVQQVAPAAVAEGAAFSVDPTISVNRTVASTVSASMGALEPVRNSPIRSAISIAFSPTKGMWSVPGSST